MRPPPPLALVLSALAFPSTAQIGSVVRAQKIDAVSGGLVAPGARLGYALASVGDLNRDGVSDVAAGLPTHYGGGEDRGALLVLFLRADGTVASQQGIHEGVGGFTATLPDDAYFGVALASPGDLDRDGRQELAVRTYVPQSVWILFLEPNGRVREHTEIPWSDPVYAGRTEPSDFRTIYDTPGLAAMGDLDGDGVGDLAVGAPGDDDGGRDAGAVWILHLRADGTAKAAKKLAPGTPGFPDDVPAASGFGYSLACLGDVNGDGFGDLSASAPGRGEGRRWILFLDRGEDVIGATSFALTGSVAFGALGDLDGDGVQECASPGMGIAFFASDGHRRKTLWIQPGRNGMPEDPGVSRLGDSLAPLGDLDHDGAPEVAVGDFGGESGGALWILSLARTSVQNGSGVNPRILNEVSEPVIGAVWKAGLDCSGHGRGVAAVFGFERPLSGVFVPAGELLVDLSSRRAFLLAAPHAGGVTAFSAAVPPSAALVNLQLHVQGACGGAPGTRLSNALYVLVGS